MFWSPRWMEILKLISNTVFHHFFWKKMSQKQKWYGDLRLSCQRFLYVLVIVHLVAFRKCFWTVKLHKTLALAEQNVCAYKHVIFPFFSILMDQIKCSDHFSVFFGESITMVTQNKQMDISTQSWNELTNLLERKYLKSVF